MKTKVAAVHSLVVLILFANTLSSPIEPVLDLGSKFAPGCMWLLFNESLIVNNSHIDSYVLVNEKEMNSEVEWSKFVTSNGLNSFCLVSFITDTPSKITLRRISQLSLKFKSYVIFSSENVNDSRKILESDAMVDVMNAVVVVPATESRNLIFSRQLFTPSGKPVIKIAATWNKRKGFSLVNSLFPDQVSNLHGNLLTGITLYSIPLADYEILNNTKFVKPKPSLDFFMLDVISKKLNFTYVVRQPDDGKFGTIGPDGKFLGTVGELQRRQANFSLVLSITLDRVKAISFSGIYFFDPVVLVTSTKQIGGEWVKILTPFQGQVWIVLCVTLFVACVLYLPLLKLETAKRTIIIDFGRSSIQMISSFFAQHLSNSPEMLFTRVFLGIWFLYSFLMTTYYKTSLTATLAVPPSPPTIDTLEELLQSGCQISMIDAKGSVFEMFSGSKDAVHQTVLQNALFLPSEVAMKKVAKGGFAYIYFRSNIENIITSKYTNENGLSNMHIAKEELYSGGFAWGFPKGSPYIKNFDKIMQRCLETGLQTYWMGELKRISLLKGRQVKGKSGADDTEIKTGKVVLNLKHIQGAFVALAFGYFLASLTFVAELIFAKFNRINTDVLIQLHEK